MVLRFNIIVYILFLNALKGINISYLMHRHANPNIEVKDAQYTPFRSFVIDISMQLQ